jgi:HAD superfamily hydrolase (TIGR01549 family)
MVYNIFENKIDIIIWDVDGTLYKPTNELHDEIRKNEIQVIQKHLGWPYEKARAEFYRLYKQYSPSGTAVASRIAGITVDQAAREMGELIKKTKKYFLGRDEKLVDLFRKLAGYRHYILSNGSTQNVLGTLELIGLTPEIFTEIVTSEQAGENKPGLNGFKYILNKTGLPPAMHLMVGDRESVDIIPAKEVGMKTCLVWGTTGSLTAADFLAQSLYDIPDLISL